MNPYYIDLPLPADLAERMQATQQNPRYHAEGDVYAHTCMVVRMFQEMGGQFSLTAEDEQVLYWAAVLHDIGKTVTTKFEDGRWTSPGHERAGVPMALDILLARPEVDDFARRRILNLVRWHGLPLRWTQRQGAIEELKLLNTRTDMRMLAIFAQFDFHGRQNVEKDHTLKAMADFQQVHTPRVEYELGRYRELEALHNSWSRRQRNAAWSAVRLERPDLIEKLASAKATADETPLKKVLVTIGLPLSGKTHWLNQHYKDAFRISLAEHHLEEDDAPTGFNLDRRLVEFKYMLDNYLRQNEMIILESRGLNEGIRQGVNALLRDQPAEIHYIIFETPLEEILRRNRNSETPMDETQLRDMHAGLDLIHPWEAHLMHFVRG